MEITPEQDAQIADSLAVLMGQVGFSNRPVFTVWLSVGEQWLNMVWSASRFCQRTDGLCPFQPLVEKGWRA